MQRIVLAKKTPLIGNREDPSVGGHLDRASSTKPTKMPDHTTSVPSFENTHHASLVEDANFEMIASHCRELIALSPFGN